MPDNKYTQDPLPSEYYSSIIALLQTACEELDDVVRVYALLGPQLSLIGDIETGGMRGRARDERQWLGVFSERLRALQCQWERFVIEQEDFEEAPIPLGSVEVQSPNFLSEKEPKLPQDVTSLFATALEEIEDVYSALDGAAIQLDTACEIACGNVRSWLDYFRLGCFALLREWRLFRERQSRISKLL